MGFQDVMRSLAALSTTRKTASETLAQLQGDIAQVQQRRAALVMAPAARQDVEAMVTQWVSDNARAFEKEAAERLGRFAGDARAMENPRLIEAFVTLVGTEDATPASVNRALCAAMPKQVAAALVASLSRITWPENPVLQADRRAQIEALDRREAELQEQLHTLLETINQAGVNLHL